MMPKPEALSADAILELVESGHLEDARAAYDAALRRRSDDLVLVADAADFFVNRLQGPEPDRETLERGIELARRAQELARRVEDSDTERDLLLVEGIALNQLGECRTALERLDLVLAGDPDDADALLERGAALYELCRFEEARTSLERALALAPDSAPGHHTLALVAERLGDDALASEHFARARELAPDDFPAPVKLSAEEFDGAVEDALAEIPESVRRWLSNVAITVEDVPPLDDLTASDPPLSPSSLGMFRGSPFGDKASMDPWSHFPSSIVLYQRNLERFARDRDELVQEIEVTLLHEVGHFLGLDEDDLWERGLD